MWLVTTRGFYSAVSYRDEPDKMLIRARSRADLESLCDLALSQGKAEEFSADKIIKMEAADYRYRIVVSKEQWQSVVGALCQEADYDNFKNAVFARDPKRAHVYMDVWSALYKIQQS